MELIQLPKPMLNRGFKGWPEVYRISKNEESPPVGISYVIAEKTDFALVFRIMVPLLMKQHPYFNWAEVYKSLTGNKYQEQRVYRRGMGYDGEGHTYGESSIGVETVTLEELASDNATYVDVNMLSDLKMIPAFMTDIREAIKVNVTDSFMWQDGYNKKTGLCSGYLTEQPRARSLVILDISYSIPDGVSAGMMTLIKTISDVTHADLILTGGRSYFYTVDDVRRMDIHRERARIPRANESTMFNEILMSRDMDYENVITFGDSDRPLPIVLDQSINTKRWYSFYCMEYDQYGRSAKEGCGYGRWVKKANPHVQFISNTEWAKFFTRGED
jgi:hypothetical protein